MQSEDDNLNGLSFYGLHCYGCFLHEGKTADLARDLRRELRAARFDKSAEALSEVPFFKVFKGYPACYEVLGALAKVRCKRTCRGGGGPPHCKIRICCRNKGIDGCWQCEDLQKCEKLEVLCKGHGDAHIRNLNTLKRKGASAFISGKPLWYSKPKVQLKTKWDLNTVNHRHTYRDSQENISNIYDITNDKRRYYSAGRRETNRYRISNATKIAS